MKIHIYSGYSHRNRTWNIYVSGTHTFLFGGCISELEQWLIDNSHKYIEVRL
jgi:hypothetical protein